MVEIKVGCCGFCKSMKDYFSDFKLVEIQRTFYNPPKPNTAKKWRREAPNDFEFSIKAWQVITHPLTSPTFKKAKIDVKKAGFFQPIKEVFDAWEKTREIAKILKAKVILFQTPKSFRESEENIRNMKEFFSSLEREFIFAWEPRGWSPDTIKSLCSELNIIHVVDPFVSAQLYGDISYFRLHGHTKMYKHKYSDDELKFLRKKCEKDSYILFNNIYMCEDALRFKKLLDNRELEIDLGERLGKS